MAPFSIPVPSIIPLRLPTFGGPKSIDTNTRVELQCETYVKHEIFYTLDGTKPHPYAGIVQGSKTLKYSSPFCLPAGKIIIKAIAMHPKIHSMCSSVITKTFEVIKVKPDMENGTIKNRSKKKKVKVSSTIQSAEFSKKTEEISEPEHEETENGLASTSLDTNPRLCLRDAFDQLDEDSRKDDDLISSDSSSVGESIEEDKTVYDFEETSLLEEHVSHIKNYELKQEKKELKPDYLTNNGFDEVDDLVKIKEELKDDSCQCCKRDRNFLQCSSCQEINIVTARFCINCGEKLQQLCHFCKEWTLINALFCPSCGCKLDEKENDNKEVIELSSEKKKKDVFIQNSAVIINKSAQTSPIKESKNLSNASPVKKLKLPPHSPGKGYWHQQLDYICNHLKSYAYNNVEFRHSISKPVLSTFQTAELIENEESVTVKLVFSPLVMEKDIDS